MFFLKMLTFKNSKNLLHIFQLFFISGNILQNKITTIFSWSERIEVFATNLQFAILLKKLKTSSSFFSTVAIFPKYFP